MDSNYKIRFISGTVAFVLSCSVALTTIPKKVSAAGIDISQYISQYTESQQKKLKPGEFYEVPLVYEGKEYDLYVVKEGDTTSKISEKYCSTYGNVVKAGQKWEVTTKYWPAIAYLNGYPRVANEGDVFVVPDDIKGMNDLWMYLRDTKWTARYVYENDIYGKRKMTKKLDFTVLDVLKDIFGTEICKDPEFAKAYMKTVGLKGYKADDYLDLGAFVKLTIWIPTFEDMGYDVLEGVSRRR